MNQVTKDEFKILKTFMKISNHTMSQSSFDTRYPRDSEIRISAVRLINELHLLEYPPILDENKRVTAFNSNEIRITPEGRFAYKLYKDDIRHERNRIIIDKSIPFCSLIISFLALIKSYGCGIDDIILWCTQLLKR